MARTMKSFAWSFLEQGSSKLVSMVVQIILGRILAPEIFGLLAILLVVTHVADSIAQSGLGMALIQKKDATDDSYSTALWLSLGLAAVLYIAVFALAPLFASFYQMPELVGYLRVLALCVLFNSFNSIQRSYLQRNMDFHSLFRVSLAAVVISGVVGVVMACLDFGLWALVAQTLVQGIVTCLVMLAVVPWKPSLKFSASEARELFGYGWKICVTGVLNVLYSGISELVIGRTCSAGELGYYSQGRKYPVAAIGVMTNSIANVLFPAFSALKDDKEKLEASIRRSLSIGTFIVAPASLLFAAVAEPLIAILLTEKWLPCTLIFQLTCVANSVLMLQLVNLRAYMALGDSGLYMRLQIIKVLLGIFVISGTAILTGDIYATAWATFGVGMFNVLVVDLWPANRVLGYGGLRQIKDQMPIYVVSLVAFAVALLVGLIPVSYPIALVLQTLAYVGVYVGLSFVLNVPAMGECLSFLRARLSRSGNRG